MCLRQTSVAAASHGRYVKCCANLRAVRRTVSELFEAQRTNDSIEEKQATAFIAKRPFTLCERLLTSSNRRSIDLMVSRKIYGE